MEKKEFPWTTPKNIPIYACEWSPIPPAKAVIVLVHGIGEHIGRYEHVAQFFNQNHIAFIGADLIGHGKSGGQRGHVDSYDDFMILINWMIAEAENRYSGLPVILYGHSMGGNLVLYYGLTQDSNVKGIIATSPGLEVAKVAPLTQFLGKLMYSVFPRFSVNNSLDVTGLSPDQNVVTTYQNDPLVHPKVSARLGLDIMKNGLWIRENAAKITKPLFIAHGDNDRLASISGTRDFVQRAKGDLTYREFPGGYHELHNSPEQTILFDEILKWVDSKILAGAERPS